MRASIKIYVSERTLKGLRLPLSAFKLVTRVNLSRHFPSTSSLHSRLPQEMFQFTSNSTSKPSKLIKINTCQFVHERWNFSFFHKMNILQVNILNSFSSLVVQISRPSKPVSFFRSFYPLFFKAPSHGKAKTWNW